MRDNREMVVTREPGPARELFLPGWTRQNSLVLRACERAVLGMYELLLTELALDGARRPIATLPDSFASTVRLDQVRGRLYVTRAVGGIQNVHLLTLADGKMRQLTTNEAPGISFSGIHPIGDEAIVFARDERRHDIWLVKKEERATMSTMKWQPSTERHDGLRRLPLVRQFDRERRDGVVRHRPGHVRAHRACAAEHVAGACGVEGAARSHRRMVIARTAGSSATACAHHRATTLGAAAKREVEAGFVARRPSEVRGRWLGTAGRRCELNWRRIGPANDSHPHSPPRRSVHQP